MSKSTTRVLMLSDITNLSNLLNRAEYNCKAVLKHKGRAFRNHREFQLPDISFEESRQYVLNNLIDLKDLLNEIDLGTKDESNKITDEVL